jgi:hypothetical protein
VEPLRVGIRGRRRRENPEVLSGVAVLLRGLIGAHQPAVVGDRWDQHLTTVRPHGNRADRREAAVRVLHSGASAQVDVAGLEKAIVSLPERPAHVFGGPAHWL